MSRPSITCRRERDAQREGGKSLGELVIPAVPLERERGDSSGDGEVELTAPALDARAQREPGRAQLWSDR